MSHLVVDDDLEAPLLYHEHVMPLLSLKNKHRQGRRHPSHRSRVLCVVACVSELHNGRSQQGPLFDGHYLSGTLNHSCEAAEKR